jgi:hypothetical protein
MKAVLAVLDRVWSDAVNFHTDATKVDSDAAKVDSDAAKVDSDAAKVESDAAKVDSDAVKVDSDAAKVDSDAAKVDHDAAKVNHDAAKVDHDAAKVDHDSVRVRQKRGLSPNNLDGNEISCPSNAWENPRKGADVKRLAATHQRATEVRGGRLGDSKWGHCAKINPDKEEIRQTVK